MTVVCLDAPERIIGERGFPAPLENRDQVAGLITGILGDRA